MNESAYSFVIMSYLLVLGIGIAIGALSQVVRRSSVGNMIVVLFFSCTGAILGKAMVTVLGAPSVLAVNFGGFGLPLFWSAFFSVLFLCILLRRSIV
jgi:hypothetical protein